MVEGIGGSSHQPAMQRHPVKYVQHDYAYHSTLTNGSKVVVHAIKETIVTASVAKDRSHSVAGQKIDVFV
ncbi:hypothetical protein [Tumebacillus lipolyticus]|uniref:Uncharacterized protein n=1 Tax=Tumebacillus lipolyticus TaxID=1280370 RepID=A0ABW5A0T6_9BACL